MSIVIEILDKLVLLNDQKVVLQMKFTNVKDLKIGLGYFMDYSKPENDQLSELVNLDKETMINTISFWYNEAYNTYTIELITDKQSFEGNFDKKELLTFLSAIQEHQVLASTVDINKINYNQ